MGAVVHVGLAGAAGAAAAVAIPAHPSRQAMGGEEEGEGAVLHEDAVGVAVEVVEAV